MRLNAMYMQQQQAQQQARKQAGQILYDQMPQQSGIPQPPPGTPAGGPQAPPPGAMSPGGGNPMAPGGASVMAPPGPAAGGGMPPPPMMQAARPAPQQAAQPMPQMAPPPIPPFRALPSAPPPGAAPGQVPPPPAMAAPAANDGVQQPHPMDLKSIIGGLRKSGVPGDQVMNMLDTLAPVMNAQNKQELEFFKANNAALKAANDAYAKVMTAMASTKRADTGAAAETRRTDQGQQNIDIKRDKENRLKASAAAAAGGAGFLKTTELVYPKGANGQPDQTQAPIGVRGITKTGKIINLDAEGIQVPTLEGGTAKEGKATGTSQRDAVRTSIVKSGITNAIARLDEIEKAHPFGATSSFFGQHGDNPLTRGAYGAAKSLQGGAQQDIDAKWASLIDEAIPVFTGGLRGSDAFRRFLIEQAPGPGDKPATIKEKMRLFRQNIEGTSKAFFNKYSSDPSFWGPGVKPEEVKGGAAPKQGEWKVEKVN